LRSTTTRFIIITIIPDMLEEEAQHNLLLDVPAEIFAAYCDFLTVADICVLSTVNHAIHRHLMPASKIWNALQAVPSNVQPLCLPSVALSHGLGPTLPERERVRQLTLAQLLEHPKGRHRVLIDKDLVYHYKHGVWLCAPAADWQLADTRYTRERSLGHWRDISPIECIARANKLDVSVLTATSGASAYSTRTGTYYRYGKGVFIKHQVKERSCVMFTPCLGDGTPSATCFVPAAVPSHP
jgi:hypothetical protein